jgi:NCS1 family nucleobase:cation symporter-1
VLITRFKSPIVLIFALVSLGHRHARHEHRGQRGQPRERFREPLAEEDLLPHGGFITGIIGILIQPWKLVADPTGYIFTWLVGYSALLGSIGGVMICDYYVIRNREARPDRSSTSAEGPTGYSEAGEPGGRSSRPSLGILPNLPGFLGTIKAVKVAPFWTELYHYAWFVGFLVAFVVYFVGTKLFTKPATAPAQPALSP